LDQATADLRRRRGACGFRLLASSLLIQMSDLGGKLVAAIASEPELSNLKIVIDNENLRYVHGKRASASSLQGGVIRSEQVGGIFL
jgi:hypothetical protein